jgi:quinol monooxygenase YgiN
MTHARRAPVKKALAVFAPMPALNRALLMVYSGLRFVYVVQCVPRNQDLSKGATQMFIVHVHVHVKPNFVQAFKQTSLENARNSVQEPGIARFDVIQQLDDPTRFVLVEVYRTKDDPARHKETAHYTKWRDTVAEMMAEPRSSAKYDNVFPDDQGWD